MSHPNPAIDPCGFAEWQASKAPEYDDDYDDMTVAELDEVIDEWELDIPKSLKKAAKIAAIRASDAEDSE